MKFYIEERRHALKVTTFELFGYSAGPFWRTKSIKLGVYLMKEDAERRLREIADDEVRSYWYGADGKEEIVF